jgi:hypothetical protein
VERGRTELLKAPHSMLMTMRPPEEARWGWDWESLGMLAMCST